MTILDQVFLTIVVIVLIVFVLSRLLGWIIPITWVTTISTWNVLEREFVTDLLVNVNVLKDMKVKDAKEHHVLMTVQVTVDVNTLKIFLMVPHGMIG